MPKEQTQKRYFLHYMPWFLLLVGLAVTFVLHVYIQKQQRDELDTEFLSQTDKITDQIANRMNNYIQALLSTRGLFIASDTVSREEFRSFVASLETELFLPAIQAIGYSEFVGSSDNIVEFEQEIQSDGYPAFVVHPNDARPEYHSIKYIEPFDDRNKRAFGYDMFSEPVRRTAMQRARDTNIPALSERVTLLQEYDEDVQPGTLIYVPFYKEGAPVETLEERRANLEGFVYAALRMRNVFESIRENLQLDTVHISVYTKSADPENILYQEHDENTHKQSLFVRESHLQIGEAEWVIEYHSTTVFDAKLTSYSEAFTLASGLVVSLLLFFFGQNLVSTTKRAEEKAQIIGEKLRRANETWRLALEATGDGVWDWDISKNTIHISDAWKEKLGIDTEKDIDDTAWFSRVHPEDIDQVRSALQAHTSGKADLYTSEHRIQTKDGSYIWVLDRGRVLRSDANKPERFIGTQSDISPQKRIEESLNERNTKLERMNDIMIGRELKMGELKDKIEVLEQQLDEDTSLPTEEE